MGITGFGRLGHYSNNVYKTAVESLPRRRADVIMLVEHFRSHPQIIGFSNRHIYLQRLELKKDPNWGKRLPVGSGVNAQQIVGIARRGKNGRSWMNMPEAEAVVERVQQLRVGDSRSLRLGIVTPFVAQKARDAFLYAQGYDVLRATSREVLETPFEVIHQIEQRLLAQ